jgi:hypothetical protein
MMVGVGRKLQSELLEERGNNNEEESSMSCPYYYRYWNCTVGTGALLLIK